MLYYYNNKDMLMPKGSSKKKMAYYSYQINRAVGEIGDANYNRCDKIQLCRCSDRQGSWRNRLSGRPTPEFSFIFVSILRTSMNITFSSSILLLT